MKKILLVDDLGIDLMLTRMALEGYGASYDIADARDGEEAYRMVQDGQFDLLLLDIKMPRVDGFELLERLRGEGPMPAPAIILSGSGLASDRARAQALGAIDYVQKPVDYGVFKETLKATLGRHGLI
jgi:CheY-like chemotaxis protein